MKISKQMLQRHLEYITLGYLDGYDEPPDDIEDYDDWIEEFRLSAERAGDLPFVKLALDHLLSSDESLKPYDGGLYPYPEHQLYEIFEGAWDAVWPDDRLSRRGEAAVVDLVDMTADEWAERRERMNG